MPAFSSAFLRPRFGLENTATPGTRVGANLVLQSMTEFTCTPKVPRTGVKAVGTLAMSGVYGSKEHTEWSGGGIASYNDLAFLLSSAACVPTKTTVGTGVDELVFRPKRGDANTIQTFSIERGSSGNLRFAHAYASDFSMQFGEREIKYTVSGMGGQFQEGADLTANPTEVVRIPIEPNTVNVFVADTLAGLSLPAAKLLVCKGASFGISGRRSPVFTLDSDVPTFTATVESAGSNFEAMVNVGQDEQGTAMMNRMRASGIFFLRIEATSRQEIVTGQPRKFTLTVPVSVKDTNRADSDDLYTGEYQMDVQFVENAFGAGINGLFETKIRLSSAGATQVITSSNVAAPTANFDKFGMYTATI